MSSFSFPNEQMDLEEVESQRARERARASAKEMQRQTTNRHCGITGQRIREGLGDGFHA
eukprot:m.84608 g.84608  ORF g.84608 m.84608 type:complete len:59 (+) comp11320_c0_seq1:464-640(+)